MASCSCPQLLGIGTWSFIEEILYREEALRSWVPDSLGSHLSLMAPLTHQDLALCQHFYWIKNVFLKISHQLSRGWFVDEIHSSHLCWVLKEVASYHVGLKRFFFLFPPSYGHQILGMMLPCALPSQGQLRARRLCSPGQCSDASEGPGLFDGKIWGTIGFFRVFPGFSDIIRKHHL